METPKSARVLRSTRSHTPRLSERKKSLFASKEEAQEDLMDGLAPLDVTTNTNSGAPKSKRCIKSMLACKEPPNSISFLRDDGYLPHSPSPSRHSLCLNSKIVTSPCRRSPRHTNSAENNECQKKPENGKENVPISVEAEEQLQLLFNSSMKLDCGHKQAHIEAPLLQVNASNANEYNSSSAMQNKDGYEARKRQIEDATNLSGVSPRRKVRRVANDSALPGSICISTKSFYSNAKTSPTSIKQLSPTVKTSITSPKMRRHYRRNVCPINKGVSHKIRRRHKNCSTSSRSANQSIDIDHILINVRNEKLRNLIANKRQEKIQIEKIHQIFKNNQNPIEMARPLSAISSFGNDCTNNNNNVETNANNKNSSVSLEDDMAFSDIECNSEDDYSETDVDTVEVTQPIENQQQTTTIQSPTVVTTPKTIRKFFKSGHSTNTIKEVQITDNIKASVLNGRISLIHQEKKRKKKIKLKNIAMINEFSDEQATVEAILKNLDDTAFGDITGANISDEEIAAINSEEACLITDTASLDLQLDDNTDYSQFRNRLPYNTSDPELIEQQHLLLDFLINNNICTEDNFTIFIADPDNHKERASQIVDQVIVVVNEQSDFRQRIPYDTNDPAIIQQQNNLLDFLIENNICTEENFDIFIANYESRCNEAELIVQNVLTQNEQKSQGNTLAEYISNPSDANASDVKTFIDNCNMEVEIGNQNTIHPFKSTCNVKLPGRNAEEIKSQPVSATPAQQPEKLFPIFCNGKYQKLIQKSSRKLSRVWTGGHGANQYQIDAGQKKFGAQQCKQCGLVYTVHEPEEEKLHREYHASLHVLRFKGWIDEDLVAIYAEWGSDGRILRIADSSHQKRKERLIEVLKIVDKELGFASYIIPKAFVAYFAVRKNQIVGLCLVQPLQKANKYISVNGVDCCTEEEYEAKCGVSRIWVSPLHRRLHIASKLIQAVQFNTIFGEEISLDKIAFSAPTENGKNFAQKVTKMEHFLVYQ